jgi:hypothetical protein
MGLSEFPSGDIDISELEKKEIESVIEQFFDGIRKLDVELISEVFHPQSSSFSITPRGVCIEPFESWPRIIKQAKDDSAHLFHERFSLKILRTDITGSAASAKVEWTFESTRIVDYYNLLKIEGKWLIVNQVYHTIHSGEND